MHHVYSCFSFKIISFCFINHFPFLNQKKRKKETKYKKKKKYNEKRLHDGRIVFTHTQTVCCCIIIRVALSVANLTLCAVKILARK